MITISTMGIMCMQPPLLQSLTRNGAKPISKKFSCTFEIMPTHRRTIPIFPDSDKKIGTLVLLGQLALYPQKIHRMDETKNRRAKPLQRMRVSPCMGEL